MSDTGEMYSYLVLPACQQINFQQSKVFRLLEHFVSGIGQFFFGGVGCGVHELSFVPRQVRSDSLRLPTAPAMNDGEIFLLRFFPVFLQTEPRLSALREDEYPRCLPVQPVNDEDAVPGLGITLA